MKVYILTLIGLGSLLLGSCVPDKVVKHYNEHIVFSGKIENTSAKSFQLFEQVLITGDAHARLTLGLLVFCYGSAILTTMALQKS